MAVNNSSSSNSPSLSQLKGPPGRQGPPGPAGPPGEPVSGRFSFMLFFFFFTAGQQLLSSLDARVHRSHLSSFGSASNNRVSFGGMGNRCCCCTIKVAATLLSGNVFPDYLVLSARFKSGRINDRSAAGHRRRGGTKKQKKKTITASALSPHQSLVNLHVPTYLNSYVVRAQAVEEERKTFIAHFMFLRSARSATQSVFPKLQRETIILSLSSSRKVIKASPQALQMKHPE